MSQLLQSVFSGLALGSLFAVIGIGFVIIHRVTGVLNLAQGALAVLGAYLMSDLVGTLPWVASLLVGSAVVAVVAALIGVAVITARQTLEYSPTIMTLGIAIASQGVFVLIWGDLPHTYPPISQVAWRVAGAFVLPQQLLLLVTASVALVLLQLFFSRAYLGKALTAAALNPRSAQLVGIDLVRVGTIAFAVSGAVAGASGAIFGALVPVTPHSHLGLAVAGFAAAVLGNLYSPTATMAGGLLLGQLTSAAATYGLPEYQQVVALVVLILVLLGRTLWQRRGGVLT
jgi:branched-chain amino acid transport system permease protein